MKPARLAVDEDMAEVIVLGYAGLAEMATRLEARRSVLFSRIRARPAWRFFNPHPGANL